MGIIEFSLKRRVTVAMAAIAVSMFGAVAFSRLPINLLPEISYPSLTVESRYPGAAPAEVETLLSRPIEEAVGVVAGVQRITSVSRPGISQVTLEFDWGRNMDFAALDVRQKLDLLALPRESSKPVLLRFDPSNDPIMRLYLSGSDDLFQLRYLAEEVLKKDLESTEGLAAVKINGGFEEEIQVRVDEGKLSLLGLGIAEVRDRLARENINQAGGSLYEKEARYLVRSRNEFEDLDDILATVIFSEGQRIVTLGDVAVVERGHRQREVVTRFGRFGAEGSEDAPAEGDLEVEQVETGRVDTRRIASAEAVELALYKEGDANTVRVAQAVEQRLGTIRQELPEGVAVSVGVDQSGFIRASISEVLENAALGGAIAVVILLLFLGDLRSTLIIGVSIPLSIVATFFLMYRTGTSLNIMSLGGLALGVGMLVDNAIVVLESIHKYREQGLAPFEAARRGASEVGQAVIASTLTTVAVFLPVVFLEGIAAQLFRDQALTVSFSLIASLAVSLTLIPMLAALASGRGETAREPQLLADMGWPQRITHVLFVRGPAGVLSGLRWVLRQVWTLLAVVTRPVSRAFEALMSSLLTVYPKVLRASLAARPLVILVAFGAFTGAVLLVPSLGLDLIPTIAQGEFSYRVELGEGTPLDNTDRFVADVQKVLDGDPRVASFSSIAGGAGLSLTSTGTEGENVARIQVRMAPGTTRADEDAVSGLIRERLESVEGARFKFERPSVFTFRTPIEVEVYSDNLEELHTASEALRERIAAVPGVVDLESTAELGNPELQVEFNRTQLVQLGLDLAQVAETVRNKVQGNVATRFTEGDREIDILVHSVEIGAASVDEVGDLIVGQRRVGGFRTIRERTETGFMVDREVQSGVAHNVPIRLETVADIHLAEGPSEIRRVGQKRAALIRGNLSGRDMGAVAADIEAVIAETPLPLGATATLGGQQEEMARSLESLLLAMGLAIFLVYLVMASQFESFLHPFVIIFSLPLGAIGVVGALYLTGNTINVVALIGAVMLAGIVVNNAIVLIDAVNRYRREEGMEKTEALVEAGKQRLRPILMTTATTVFGLLPMALGLGEGAELRAPLAITVIGGLAVATLLTLIVIPVVYSLLDRQGSSALAGEMAEDDAERLRPDAKELEGVEMAEAAG